MKKRVNSAVRLHTTATLRFTMVHLEFFQAIMRNYRIPMGIWIFYRDNIRSFVVLTTNLRFVAIYFRDPSRYKQRDDAFRTECIV